MDNVPHVALQRRREKTCVPSASVAALPDDVVLEILVRVDDGPTLFRCAMACKLWRALMADLFFLRGRSPNGVRHRYSLLGFVARCWPKGETLRYKPPAFVPAPRSPLGPSPRLLGSFFPCANGLLDDAVPLIMRSGLILVEANPMRTGVRLAVCNLLTGTCDVLPTLNGNVFSVRTKYVILADTDYCSKERPTSLPSYSTFFEVAIIFFDYYRAHYSLCTFSSANSSWSTPRRCLHHMEKPIINGNAVVCHGKVHWLIWNMGNIHTFELCIATGHLSTSEFPIPLNYLDDHIFGSLSRLSLSVDGKLSLVLMHTKYLQLHIWTRQDNKDSSDGDAAKLQPKVIELKHKLPLTSDTFDMHVGETSGTLLITDLHKFTCIVNLETGTIDEVASMFYDLNLYDMVPIEMDWPAFFMSRLEGTRANVSDNP